MGRTGLTGVHPATGLASDYLNHFYEPLMMLEHLSADADFADELANWSPNSYIGHFGSSGRPDRLEVLASYMNAPAVVRHRLDEEAGKAGEAISSGIANLIRMIREGGDTDAAAIALAGNLRRHIQRIDAIISGNPPAPDARN